MPNYLETVQGRRIAYFKSDGNSPTLVFLGGFKSDMEGAKAKYLEGWARDNGQSFLRFDYSGHGASSGNFSNLCLSDWLEDSIAVIEQLTEGPQILVGSSMGGWISLLLAEKIPQKII